MKTKLLLISLTAILFVVNNANAQIITSNSRFKALSYEELLAPVLAAQKAHENSEKYLDALVSAVNDVRGNNNIDNILKNELDEIYRSLVTYYDKPLAYVNIQRELKKIELSISEKIISFKRRMTSNNKSEPNRGVEVLYKTNIKSLFCITNYTIPLREFADPSSKMIYECPFDADIYILDISDNVYAKVSINGHIGYISRGYLLRNKI